MTYEEVLGEIGESWGREQVLSGPVLVVPYSERFTVTETRTNPDAPGSEYSVAAGNSSASGKVESTGGWDKYKTAEIGTLRIEQAGTVTVVVRPVTKPGYAVMNLRSVKLVPAE